MADAALEVDTQDLPEGTQGVAAAQHVDRMLNHPSATNHK
jgi:hypothetical protein